ncbi:hypothetical protein CTI12_AA284610 [Artemisia annua]|uniref:Uncharacterized protein n=1 Tax=Artemisia annua TaxID=35608 RepID=A0A2U1N4S4_ARTAN|nr:hypothetical protein CTI12_AA284610 [Artemisia annua]
MRRNLNKQSQSSYALLAGVVVVEVTIGLTIDSHWGGRIQISRLMKDVFLMQSKGSSNQACANLYDKSYLDSLIKVGSCYHLTNYIEVESTTMKKVPRAISIELGEWRNL